MKPNFKSLMFAFSLVLILSLFATSTAYAITIVVDGAKDAAWDGSGGQTPGTASDGDEAGIINTHDIKEVRWTNDQTYLYFLIETYSATDLTGGIQPYFVICLDTDNNTATGDTYANCNNMSGIDRSIVFTRSYVEIYVGDPDSGDTIDTASTLRRTATVFTELRVDLASLGLDSSSGCIQNIKGAVYFDGQSTEPDDNTPNSGTIDIGCGTPTVLRVNDLSSRSAYGWPLAAGLFGAVAIMAGSAVTWVNRRRKA